MVILREQSDMELLYFKRNSNDLKTKIDASATLNPGVNGSQLHGSNPWPVEYRRTEARGERRPAVAQAFTSGVSQLVSAATQPLTDATNELNSVVPNLLKKLPSLTVDAAVTFETVTQHTVFGVFDFSPCRLTPRPGS